MNPCHPPMHPRDVARLRAALLRAAAPSTVAEPTEPRTPDSGWDFADEDSSPECVPLMREAGL